MIEKITFYATGIIAVYLFYKIIKSQINENKCSSCNDCTKCIQKKIN